MTDFQRLLIVDDEKKIRDLLTHYLTQEGFEVQAVGNATEMDACLEQHEFDLIILDLMLPGEDGLSIGRRLHQKSNIGIIILSARSDEIDRIIGLEVGADDYLVKPFNPRELLARIRSVLRRRLPDAVPPDNHSKGILIAGPFQLDLNAHSLSKNNRLIEITHSEFNMLSLFFENKNKVLSRDQLLEMSKGYERTPFDRSIDICVGRLRKKIETSPTDPIYLKTIWGVGYIFSITTP